MQPHVLLIDDLDDDREMYSVGLQLEGFEVTVADIDHGLSAATTDRPDVVVLEVEQVEDWNMCDELRLIFSGIPVVVLTAAIRPNEANRRRARRTVNCAAFVGKPCTPEELAAVIARVLGGERGIEQTLGRQTG